MTNGPRKVKNVCSLLRLRVSHTTFILLSTVSTDLAYSILYKTMKTKICASSHRGFQMTLSLLLVSTFQLTLKILFAVSCS